jgi:hypothetical protein
VFSSSSIICKNGEQCLLVLVSLYLIPKFGNIFYVKSAVLWDLMALYSLEEVYRRFEERTAAGKVLCMLLGPYLAYSSTLKVRGSTETSVNFYQTTRRPIPEDSTTLHSHRFQKLKSDAFHIVWLSAVLWHLYSTTDCYSMNPVCSIWACSCIYNLSLRNSNSFFSKHGPNINKTFIILSNTMSVDELRDLLTGANSQNHKLTSF